MRALLHVDVVTLGRSLLAVEAVKRAQLCDNIFDQAHAADKYRKRFGTYHRHWGSGSLASACWNLEKRAEPFLSDRDYAECLKIIYERVLHGG